MKLKHNFIKFFLKKNIYIYLYIFLVNYLVSVFLYLTYDIVLSPDFEKYLNYFYFYDQKILQTGLEQGNFYYYFNYFFGVVFNQFYEYITVNELLNISIHFTNSLIVFLGFIGLFKFLEIKKFNTLHILAAITVVTTSPPIIQLKLNFKPEILAFCILIWLIYLLEAYKFHQNNYFLVSFISLYSLLLALKISITVISSAFLIFYITFEHKHLIVKKNLKYLVITFLTFSLLSVQNFLLNDKFITQVEHEEKYNNKASTEFFTNINSKDLINNPNRYFHKESFLSITLFDTFGDFFKLYWDSEYTELFLGRYNFFTIGDSNNYNQIPSINFDSNSSVLRLSANFDNRFNDINYVNETRQRASFKYSLIFYFLVASSLIFRYKTKLIILSPLLGIFFIAMSAAGVFTNNFDPNIGDSVKAFYYSFFTVISFTCLLAEFFKQKYIPVKTLSIFIILINLFLIGFPFQMSQKNVDDIYYKNSIIATCEVNKPVINMLLGSNDNNPCDHNQFVYKSSDFKYKNVPIKIVNNIDFKFSFKVIPYLSFIIFFASLLSLTNRFLRVNISHE